MSYSFRVKLKRKLKKKKKFFSRITCSYITREFLREFLFFNLTPIKHVYTLTRAKSLVVRRVYTTRAVKVQIKDFFLTGE